MLTFLQNHMLPKLSEPDVWLWIIGNDFDAEIVIAFMKKNMKDYILKTSKYISCKSGRIDEVVNRVLVPAIIKLLFLFKKGVDGMGKGIDCMKDKYVTSSCPYYNEW